MTSRTLHPENPEELVCFCTPQCVLLKVAKAADGQFLVAKCLASRRVSASQIKDKRYVRKGTYFWRLRRICLQSYDNA